MRYGISVPCFGTGVDAALLAQWAAMAETAGWDGFFLWDHLVAFSPGPVDVVDPWIDRWYAEQGREPVVPAIELDRRETGLYLVLAGAGVVVQPRPFAEFAERLGAELRPFADAPVRAISMCRRHGPLSPAARAFVDLVPRDVAPVTSVTPCDTIKKFLSVGRIGAPG